MPTPKPQHVTPHEGGWRVRREGAERASVVTETKAEAVERAREIARREGGSVVIHGENGRIQEERTFHDDPFPPKG